MALLLNLISLLSRFRIVLLLLAVIALGFLEPISGEPLTPLTLPLVALLVFTSLDTVNFSHPTNSSYLITGVGIIIGWFVVPSLGFLLGLLFLSSTNIVGLVIILAGPTTAGSALVWARLSESDMVLTGALTILTLSLAPVVTPAIVAFLLNSQVEISALPIVRDLTFVLVIGAGLYVVVPSDIGTKSQLDYISIVSICMLVYISISNSQLQSVDNIEIAQIILVSIAILLISLIVCITIAQLINQSIAQATGVFFGSTMKNLGIAIAVATAVPIDGLIVAIVLFYITQQLFAGVVVGTVSQDQAQVSFQ